MSAIVANVSSTSQTSGPAAGRWGRPAGEDRGALDQKRRRGAPRATRRTTHAEVTRQRIERRSCARSACCRMSSRTSVSPNAAVRRSTSASRPSAMICWPVSTSESIAELRSARSARRSTRRDAPRPGASSGGSTLRRRRTRVPRTRRACAASRAHARRGWRGAASGRRAAPRDRARARRRPARCSSGVASVIDRSSRSASTSRRYRSAARQRAE